MNALLEMVKLTRLVLISIKLPARSIKLCSPRVDSSYNKPYKLELDQLSDFRAGQEAALGKMLKEEK